MRKSKYGTKIPKYTRWTPEEDKILLEGWEAGASYAKLMRLTGRRYGGVKKRLAALGAKEIEVANVQTEIGVVATKTEKMTARTMREGLEAVGL